MLHRNDWLDCARKLNWEFTYVNEAEIFPEIMSGSSGLRQKDWEDWDEPYRTTYSEYVQTQHQKDLSVKAVKEAIGKAEDFQKLDPAWINGLKLHSATLPLAEFAAVVGNLRAARFGKDSAWRSTALLGALDEFRHTQIPLTLMHELLKWDAQFDWTHKFYHSNNWVALAGRHMVDELLLTSNATEFAIATNFVFETGFTNLQFIGLSSLAHYAGDRMFEKMVNSIQSDEARHAQIGPPVLEKIVQDNPEYAQYLVDKWFWRSWHLFAVVTGFSMDYFTPLHSRKQSFKEFMEEWVIDQFANNLNKYGLKKPWYWDTFLQSLNYFHHMVYNAAYSYRATVWFDFVVPSPQERRWLRHKYPSSWDSIDPIWERINERWAQSNPENDFGVHGTAIVSFCDLCQFVLCEGTPLKNSAIVHERDGKKYIFCSQPCLWMFEKEPERYADHKDVVKRVLAGEAPANVIALIQEYFDLNFGTWGKDVYGGKYPWIKRGGKPS